MVLILYNLYYLLPYSLLTTVQYGVRPLRGGVQGHESCPEAGGEVRRRLRHPAFSSSHLGRVAAEEVVHRLQRQQQQQFFLKN